MGLIPIAAVLLLTVASIESSYYYTTSANHFYPPRTSSYLQTPYMYYASRVSQPIYYVRHFSRSAPIRKLARAYKIKTQETSSTIILNDTAVPFTVSKSALSTPEYEKNPNHAGEEGVGPAVEVEAPALGSRLSPRSKVPAIISKGAAVSGKEKSKIKAKLGAKKPSFEPEVVYSDIHPIYVKPPNDFRPVVYPNRRLDGVRYTNRLSNQVPLSPIPPPFPFGYPRGLSSWSLGGPKAISRGNYWESLSSDEALNLQPEANIIHPSTSSPTAAAANFNGRSKLSHSQRPITLPPFLPWFMIPSSSSLFSYEVQHPAPASSVTIIPLSQPLPPVPGTKAVSGSSKESRIIPSIGNKNESAEGIRTKLPVGLSSWMLGGVRDLTGKHWKMPDLFVDNVAVVEIESNGTREDSGSGTKNNETDVDLMMTSDGEYERVVPVVSESGSEREEEDSPRDSGVVFDDDPEFVNANNNNIHIS